MAFPGREAVLSQVSSLTIECIDCGRTRVRKPYQLRGRGITDATRLSDLSSRLACAACREDGLAGRNISVQAAFHRYDDQLRAEAYLINSREVPGSGRRAKRA